MRKKTRISLTQLYISLLSLLHNICPSLLLLPQDLLGHNFYQTLGSLLCAIVEERRGPIMVTHYFFADV